MLTVLLWTGAALLLLICLLLGAMVLWRSRDHRADTAMMMQLARAQPSRPAGFDPQQVADLPEPARRYFTYCIRPGTPLYTVARLTMAGQFAMGDKTAPRYLTMRAAQTLALSAGFVWTMSAGRGAMRISGSDSHRWTRFWLLGVLPVARLGGDADHRRSAFARYVAEAVFWTPAALLPGPGVTWGPVDEHCARVTVNRDGLSQSVDLYVADDGQPTQVSFQRWSNANPDKQYRLQPFGGYLSAFRDFGGFRLPTHVEAGNQFATDDYFAFFIADISDVSYPGG